VNWKCLKHGLNVTGCAKLTGGDPLEICLKCVETGSLGDSTGKTHVIGQSDQLPPIKYRYSGIKCGSNRVI
jgi:hypothetical protein